MIEIKIFSSKKAFENVVGEMAVILSWPRCVKIHSVYYGCFFAIIKLNSFHISGKWIDYIYWFNEHGTKLNRAVCNGMNDMIDFGLAQHYSVRNMSPWPTIYTSIDMQFENKSTIIVTLKVVPNILYEFTSFQLRLHYSAAETVDDYSYRWWDFMALNDIPTSAVTLTALSHYSRLYNGFLEVEFYTGLS